MPFKRKKKDSPEVSTASLPDIIFMLLFFFMTVTVLRTASAQVTVELPETASAIKVNHEASEYNIYIGAELDRENPKVQINEYLVSMSQLSEILESISRPLMDFEKMEVPINLRVEKRVKMDIVYDVKLLLRKNGLRKINYLVQKFEKQSGN